MGTDRGAPAPGTELTPRQRRAMGAAMAACCGIPMLVVLGVVSLATAAAVGTTGGAAAAVAVALWAAITARFPPWSRTTRVAIGAAATVLAAVGIVVMAGDAGRGRPLVVVAVAALAVAAIASIASHRPPAGDCCASREATNSDFV